MCAEVVPKNLSKEQKGERFDVFTMVKIYFMVFWVVVPYSDSVMRTSALKMEAVQSSGTW